MDLKGAGKGPHLKNFETAIFAIELPSEMSSFVLTKDSVEPSGVVLDRVLLYINGWSINNYFHDFHGILVEFQDQQLSFVLTCSNILEPNPAPPEPKLYITSVSPIEILRELKLKKQNDPKHSKRSQVIHFPVLIEYC